MKKILILVVLFSCFIMNTKAQNKINQYEYWLDTNYIGKQIINISPSKDFDLNASISNPSLTLGLHSLNFRFKDDSSRYSATISQLIEAFTISPQINGYEYWFDETYSSKIFIVASPSESFNLNVSNIDATGLNDGMHSFNIRFRDHSLKWSHVEKNIFYKSGNSAQIINTVSGYRYWIDSGFSNNAYKSLSNTKPYAYIDDLVDLSSFSNGNKTIHIQFQDEMGLWSSVISDTLTVAVGINDNNASTEYIHTFPSPTDGSIYILSNIPNAEKTDIYISNAFGELVYLEKSQNIDMKKISLDYLPSGMYFIKIKTPEHSYLNKIMLQK